MQINTLGIYSNSKLSLNGKYNPKKEMPHNAYDAKMSNKEYAEMLAFESLAYEVEEQRTNAFLLYEATSKAIENMSAQPYDLDYSEKYARRKYIRLGQNEIRANTNEQGEIEKITIYNRATGKENIYCYKNGEPKIIALNKTYSQAGIKYEKVYSLFQNSSAVYENFLSVKNHSNPWVYASNATIIDGKRIAALYLPQENEKNGKIAVETAQMLE